MGMGGEQEARAFGDKLQAALEDTNLISEGAAAQLADGFSKLLRAWPVSDQKHFALLYMGRLLCAASDTTAAAFVDSRVPAILLCPPSGALAAEQQQQSPRGARLRALALLSNLMARSDCAPRLLAQNFSVSGTDPASAAGGALSDAIVGAVCRAIDGGAIDAALGQIGGALAHNLSVLLYDDPEGHREIAPVLMSTALGALVGLSDADALGRTLSCIGHLLCVGDDEAVAVALSLDAPTTLDRVRDRAIASGHGDLHHKVHAKLSK
jgi:hypothetical protein